MSARTNHARIDTRAPLGACALVLALVSGCGQSEYELFWMEGSSAQDTGSLVDVGPLGRVAAGPEVGEAELCLQTDSFHQLAETDQTNLLLVIDRSIDFDLESARRIRSALVDLFWSLPDEGWELKAISSDPFAARVDAAPPLTESASEKDFLEMINAVHTGPIGGRLGLDAAREYLASPASRWIVPNTEALLTVFVTHDDYRGGAARIDRFIDEYSHGATHRSVASVVRMRPRADTVGTLCTSRGVPGLNYLAATRALRGTPVDICSPDWGRAFSAVGRELPPIQEWSLSMRPETSAEGVEVVVDGQELGAREWIYDEVANAVYFVTIPPPAAAVDISYFVECAE